MPLQPLRNCGGGGSAPTSGLGPRQERGRYPLGPPLLPQGAGDGYNAGDKTGDEEITFRHKDNQMITDYSIKSQDAMVEISFF